MTRDRTGTTDGKFFSPDGKTVHFGKPYTERTADGWSELKNRGSPFKDIGIIRLIVSSKGTYVFDETSQMAIEFFVLHDG